MSKRLLIRTLGCLSFVAILILCLSFSVSTLSAKLAYKVAQAIKDNGFDAQDFKVVGRDVIFDGEVSEQFNRTGLFSSVRRVSGVRNIIDNQKLYKIKPAAAMIIIQGDRLEFSGMFRNKDNLQAIENKIEVHFSDYKVELKAELSKKVSPMQLKLNFDEIFEQVKGNNISFNFSDKEVRLSGFFSSRQKKHQLESSILSSLGNKVRYYNELYVTDKASMRTFLMQRVGNVITIVGELDDARIKNKLINLLKAYYPTFKLDLDVSINENADNPNWVDYLSLLIPELAILIEGKFLISTQSIYIDALVNKISTKAGLLSRVDAVVDGLPIISAIRVKVVSEPDITSVHDVTH